MPEKRVYNSFDEIEHQSNCLFACGLSVSKRKEKKNKIVATFRRQTTTNIWIKIENKIPLLKPDHVHTVSSSNSLAIETIQTLPI